MQNSLESTWAGVSFLIKLQAGGTNQRQVIDELFLLRRLNRNSGSCTDGLRRKTKHLLRQGSLFMVVEVDGLYFSIYNWSKPS